jgi:hypothetical protein
MSVINKETGKSSFFEGSACLLLTPVSKFGVSHVYGYYEQVFGNSLLPTQHPVGPYSTAGRQ